jgi:hypothetical protein
MTKDRNDARTTRRQSLMSMNTHFCIDNLKQLLEKEATSFQPESTRTNLLQQFFTDIADVGLNVGGSPGSFIKARYLLWHQNNLRPTVAARANEVIATLWQEWASQQPTETPTETEGKETAAGHTAPEDFPKTEDAVPHPETPEKTSPPQPKPARRPADWFDRLLDLVAGLVTGLGLGGA